MKAIVCEMCDSNDVVKQGDYYVCQSCGTKYEPEAAKKLMVEIDDSNKLINLYDLARKARNENNVCNAENYYSQILDINPNDWEAYFYRSYYQTMGAKVAQLASAALSFDEAVGTTIEILENCSMSEDELLNVALEIEDSISTFFATFTLSAEQSQSQYRDISKEIGTAHLTDLEANLKATAKPCIRTAEWYEKKFNLNDPDCKKLRDFAVRIWSWTLDTSSEPWADFGDRTIWFKMLEKYDPELVIQVEGVYFTKKRYDDLLLILRAADTRLGKLTIMSYGDCDSSKAEKIYYKLGGSGKEPKQSGCYVATCVYGSYDCPQVWTLRRYRDYKLAKSVSGRMFIRTYYAISPTIVRLFGDTVWFRKLWRGKLDYVVRKLNTEGYMNTPYSDITW